MKLHLMTGDFNASKRNGSRAFTLRELIGILAMLLLVSSVILPSLYRGSAQVHRLQCTNQLRQIGVGLSLYAAENSDFLPICRYPNPSIWYSYLIARANPGSSEISEGYMNLGLLTRTKVLDPRALYCPAQRSDFFTYAYYTTATNEWPFCPIDSNSLIRSGYQYFPQLGLTESLRSSVLPKIETKQVALEYGAISSLAPMKVGAVNLQKSIVTDLVYSPGAASHRSQGGIAGINALFLDGRVKFQTPYSIPESFEPQFWDGGLDFLGLRILSNSWKP